jgi:hypothetical protein
VHRALTRLFKRLRISARFIDAVQTERRSNCRQLLMGLVFAAGLVGLALTCLSLSSHPIAASTWWLADESGPPPSFPTVGSSQNMLANHFLDKGGLAARCTISLDSQGDTDKSVALVYKLLIPTTETPALYRRPPPNS